MYKRERMFNKGMNKKGQEGMTLGTLLLIVLGVVVLIVLIVGFTSGFGFIFDKIAAAPGQQLQTIVKSCEVSANNELTVDYCGTLKELDSNEYVSCEYNLVSNAIDSSIKSKVTCTEGLRASLVVECADLEPSATNKIKVNGVEVVDVSQCDGLKNSGALPSAVKPADCSAAGGTVVTKTSTITSCATNTGIQKTQVPSTDYTTQLDSTTQLCCKA